MIPIIKRNTSVFELELPDFALNHHVNVSYSSHPSQPELFGNCAREDCVARELLASSLGDWK